MKTKSIITLLVCMTMGVASFAQTKKPSDWKETQTIEIPDTTTVYQRMSTRSTNIIYYFDIQGLQVSVSKGNAEKFANKEVTLELVEWENTKTGKFRYTTRQLKVIKKEENKRIDFGKIFK